MKRYQVEVIYEPTGDYLNYSFTSNLEQKDLDIYDEFIRNISIVVVDVDEVDE